MKLDPPLKAWSSFGDLPEDKKASRQPVEFLISSPKIVLFGQREATDINLIMTGNNGRSCCQATITLPP